MRKGPPNLVDAIDRIKPDSGAHEMRDPFDIGDALTSLALSGEAVTVYRRGQDFVMARIDSVDPEGKVFTLDLAEPGAVLQGKVVFVAGLGGNAKIQFELDAASSISADRADLLQFPLPETCQVLNRRAEPRLESPVGMNYGARFAMMGKVFEMPLYDFSRGGVGLRATPEQALELYVGKKLEGVQLEMGGSLVVTADLEVRLLRPFRTFLLGQQVQVGCRISNISMQMHQTLGRAVEKIQKRR
ncbi:flagellar brake protein [Massilia sp. TW-1]|uniref:Flagellar brake protein n=1 Tax=Telluria antibiotica TaxID=2717319 RepID=A0ABX0P9Z7_9BURK|nr:flagellar brake protein [Telluria antibiotica]NIA54112.1 flagellar brake protein [Telluria antibiotica]